MKRNKRIIAAGATLLLLIAVCVPVLSGALAEGEETPLVVPIDQETAVFGADGTQIGTLIADADKAAVLTLFTGEAFPGIEVVFDQAAVNKAQTNDALAGKTLVLFSAARAASTPVPSPEATQETAAQVASDVTPAPMPTEGWIDANIVLTAFANDRVADASTIADKDLEIATLKASVADTESINAQNALLLGGDQSSGLFDKDAMDIWVPAAAIALGILGLGVLVWIAVSASTSAWESERTFRQLMKLNERMTEGVAVKTPLIVEQIAWPREGHVRLAPDVVEQIAAVAAQNGALFAQVNTPVKETETPPPPPIPEGEEPDLLQLANRLAGIVSAAEWHALVKEAGLKAVLLQANPTEKGTFIADDSGYSIIACLMRSPDAQIGYVLPSYQDPNASEHRWMEFYSVNENNSVRNYRVDALAVVHIERGTFYLPKSNGRLTRRQQQF